MRTIKHPHKKENLEKYIQGLIHGVYTLRQVANFTGYTVVHLCNLKKKYQQRGAAIFINGHKGMMPKNKISENTKEKIIEIYQTQFVDSDTGNSANFLFFTKILKDLYDINYSYRTIYNILIKAGFISPKKHKIKKNTKIHHMKYELDLYDKWNEGRVEGLKEGMEIGQAQGRQEGIQQGREEGAIQTAITLLQFGDYSIEKIAECTNLPIETIEKLVR